MAVTDPVGDLLTRIRNGQRAKKDSVLSPASKLRVRVLDVLQREGYIRGYSEEQMGPAAGVRGPRAPLLLRRPVVGDLLQHRRLDHELRDADELRQLFLLLHRGREVYRLCPVEGGPDRTPGTRLPGYEPPQGLRASAP